MKCENPLSEATDKTNSNSSVQGMKFYFAHFCRMALLNRRSVLHTIDKRIVGGYPIECLYSSF